jgi:hypothetical protein
VFVSLAMSACGGSGGGTAPSATTPSRATSPPAIASSSTPPAIAIDQPAAGATLSIPFDIAGTVSVPDDALVVSIADAAGTLCEHELKVAVGGAWRTTMAFAPPAAAGPVTIRAFNRNPGDGTEANVVTRTVQLSSTPPDIVIAEPRCAADLAADSAFRVSGTARVFEATLTVELRSVTGAVVAQQHVTADAAGPATGRWSAELDLTAIPAGRYDLVAYNFSPQDGAPEHIFSIPVRITV